VAGWDLAAAFEPARQVSGDFYDAFLMADGLRIGVVVGDVCGKGVGASLFMALFRSLIRAVATRVVRSGHTLAGDPDSQLFAGLTLANDYIAEVHGSANMFATVFAAAVNPMTGAVRWVNAGHDPALVVGADGGVRARLAPTGPALGITAGVTVAVGQLRLAPGETLVIATDGVGEARDRDGAFFGDERLEALCAAPAAGAAELTGARDRGAARLRRRRRPGRRRDHRRGAPLVVGALGRRRPRRDARPLSRAPVGAAQRGRFTAPARAGSRRSCPAGRWRPGPRSGDAPRSPPAWPRPSNASVTASTFGSSTPSPWLALPRPSVSRPTFGRLASELWPSSPRRGRRAARRRRRCGRCGRRPRGPPARREKRGAPPTGRRRPAPGHAPCRPARLRPAHGRRAGRALSGTAAPPRFTSCRRARSCRA
jgi:hypothetical protein